VVTRGRLDRLPPGVEVISVEHTNLHSSMVVRADGPLPEAPWTVEGLQLEELVLAYLTRAAGESAARAATTDGEVVR
jgi:ABC-2 type transport system ATP-binding protein